MSDFIKLENIQDGFNLAVTKRSVDGCSWTDMEKVCREAGFTIENLTSGQQIHSDVVNVVEKSDIGVRKDGDALVTNLVNVPLLIFTADCVPIAIMDSENKAIGIAHSGWRGTFDTITQKAIKKMEKLYGTDPKKLKCVIGPSIGVCCYEISEELAQQFEEKFGDVCFRSDGNVKLDLWKTNELILKEAGVAEENIYNMDICTSCHCDEFYSYRKHDKVGGRIGIMLEILG
ncbi:MAG: peptidoglycan editing factor PgeF [Clostridioides sp.]|jgi:YfiH family protein|nr:peptidoglycan editing factor PgeF [Clostridioides sp.]